MGASVSVDLVSVLTGGILVDGAADHLEVRFVGLDVGVARRGAVPDEGVVGADAVGRGGAAGGGEEQQPELVAGAEAGGRQAPVGGTIVCAWA